MRLGQMCTNPKWHLEEICQLRQLYYMELIWPKIHSNCFLMEGRKHFDGQGMHKGRHSDYWFKQLMELLFYKLWQVIHWTTVMLMDFILINYLDIQTNDTKPAVSSNKIVFLGKPSQLLFSRWSDSQGHFNLETNLVSRLVK